MSNKIQALGATQSSLAQQQRTVANKKNSPRAAMTRLLDLFLTRGVWKNFQKSFTFLSTAVDLNCPPRMEVIMIAKLGIL